MTQEKIFEIALMQSAIDCNCNPEDFLSDKNIITKPHTNPKARVYLPLPFECDLVSYGYNIVAQASDRVRDVVEKYINSITPAYAFETPYICGFDKMLAPYGLKCCYMAEYFLPKLDEMKLFQMPEGYELRILHAGDFDSLYTKEWGNALCKDRSHLDYIAIGAYKNGNLVGLAGCSRDCEEMYQIGIDVLPEHRGKGIAAALTSRLAHEVLKLGKVPFYCAAWCNLPSVKNAIKCGFRPAWSTLTARDISHIEKVTERFDK